MFDSIAIKMVFEELKIGLIELPVFQMEARPSDG
jgi:hypothetical protein